MAEVTHRTFYSITKKIIMALTGLFLITFLIMHLAGNFTLFANDEGVAFNQYSVFMSTNFLIRLIEIVLVFGFLFHIVDGIVLIIQNRKARGDVRYAVYNPSPGTNWAARRMAITGSIILIFLVVHLRTFFLEFRILDTTGNINYYAEVISVFQNPFYSAFYVVAMILMGFHLYHGFYSSFRTLGLTNERMVRSVKATGLFLAIALSAGFASIPVYFYIIQFM